MSEQSNGMGQQKPTARKGRAYVANEVKLDAQKPIPFELSGNCFYSYEGDQRYIPFLDSKDNFFNILLEAKLLSPTQNACVSTRADYCTGNGITIDELKNDENLKDKDLRLFDFITNVNNKGETIRDIIHEINDHIDSFGNCWVEIIRGQAGSEKFVRIYVWNTPECRLGDDDDQDYPTRVLRSKRFLRSGLLLESKKIVTRPLLNLKRPTDPQYWMEAMGSSRTVIHLKNKVSGYPNYGLPIGVSSLTQQLIEYRGARYNLDNFENNLNPGGLIGLKGNMSKAEATAEGKNINKQLVGPGKAGKWIAIAHENGLDGIDMKEFSTQKEGSFIELDNKVEAKIILANQWNKVLAGLDDGNALGKGNGYIKSIFDMVLKKVIMPRQEYIMDNFLLPLFTICDDWMGTKWIDYTWKFLNPTPVSFISLIKNIDSAVQRNEVRSELGLPSDDSEKGNEYLSSGKPAETNPEDVIKDGGNK